MSVSNSRMGKLLATPWPLGLRICLALLLTLLVVAGVATHIGDSHRKAALYGDMKEHSMLTLRMISAGALESVLMEDVEMLETLLDESVQLDQDLISITIFNERGKQILSHDSRKLSGEGEPPDTYTYRTNIEFEGEQYGQVEATWDPARRLAAVERELRLERWGMLLALLTLTLLSLLLLHFLVVSPITKLRNRVVELSLGNQHDALELNSSREMAMLADAVNELDEVMVESRRLSHELKHQASHDALTGLLNRTALANRMKTHLEERRENDPEDTLLYIDLDQFKIVNDTCGHAAGDALLVQIARLFGHYCGPGHLLARLGGDEFAMFLKGLPLDEAMLLAEELRSEAQAFRFIWEGRAFSVEISVGVVAIRNPGESYENLLAAADEACYSAKDSGRNRVYSFQEDDQQFQQRRSEMSWVPRILAALEERRLILYGQAIEPTVVAPGAHHHFEVLVRMLDENGDVVPPGAFLPAAERFGVMSQIDRFVLTETLRWMRTQSLPGSDLPGCSINISGHSLGDPDFKEFVLSSLSDNLPLCEKLCFEITETAAVINLALAVDFINEVKELGCSFALDDFGTGMSSFTYLKNLPVNYIKIDGAFVSNLLSDPMSRAMVRSIADIASVMEIQSIAEFVETDDIRSKLGTMGIDFVQGYGVGKPVPLQEFETVKRAA